MFFDINQPIFPVLIIAAWLGSPVVAPLLLHILLPQLHTDAIECFGPAPPTPRS